MLSIKGIQTSTYTAQLRDRTSLATVGAVVNLVQETVGGSYYYSGLPTAAAGDYWADFYRDGTHVERQLYSWTGTEERTLGVIAAQLATLETTVTSSNTDITSITTELAAVKTSAGLAARAAVGNIQVQTASSRIVIYEDDGTTPALTFQYSDASSAPALAGAVRRTRV